MSVPTSLSPGNYTVAFDEQSSVALVLAGWEGSTSWPTLAQMSLASSGYPGVVISNPRTVADPDNNTGWLQACDVYVPSAGSAGYSYSSGQPVPAQFVIGGELLVSLLVAAIRAAVAITVALVVKYIVNKATTPAAPGSPLNPSPSNPVLGDLRLGSWALLGLAAAALLLAARGKRGI